MPPFGKGLNMIRSEILRNIAPIIRDHLVVCNIGLPSQELHMIDDQPTNFYMLGTMGLSSSIGLGLALAQNKKVIFHRWRWFGFDKFWHAFHGCKQRRQKLYIADYRQRELRLYRGSTHLCWQKKPLSQQWRKPAGVKTLLNALRKTPPKL